MCANVNDDRPRDDSHYAKKQHETLRRESAFNRTGFALESKEFECRLRSLRTNHYETASKNPQVSRIDHPKHCATQENLRERIKIFFTLRQQRLLLGAFLVAGF